MRLSGLASGMDTDSMVQSMMRVERMKVDRYEQNKQISMWRQEAYNDINKSFANFILNTKKDMGLNKTSSTGSIFANSYKNLDYVRKVSSSDETKISASATNEAVNGSYSVDVVNVGKGASFGSAKLTDEQGTLKDIVKDGMQFTIEINGKKANITVEKPENKDIDMSDVVKAINSATDNDVALGVTAFYDKTTGRLFMQSEDMVDGTNIVLSADADTDGKNFIDNLQLGEKGKDYAVTEGQSAQIIFNGVTLKYDTNNINLNGINMELKARGTTEIKVDTNVDGMMEKIQKFVEDYNKFLDETSKVVEEKRYNSFHPLSQEEKKAMTEDDVKLWMEKAKSGMLNKDETVNRTMQAIRGHLYKTVEGVEGPFNQITQIGITTEKYSRGSTGGKLEINEDKLRQALIDDSEGVMELLFKEGNFDSDGKEILEDNNKTSMGVFSGIYNKLIDGMKSIIDKSGAGEDASLYRGVKSNILLDFVTKKSSISDIDKAIMDMDKKIDSLNIMLARKEDAYYAKFTQMEKYLHQMNSQSGWLAQQFMY